MGNEMDIKIKNATLVTNNENNDVIADAEIHIKDGLIRYAGAKDKAQKQRAVKEIDADGNIVMPGFFNMHTHIPMNMFRSFADDLPLMDWLNKRIFPAEDKLTAEMTYWASKAALCEMAAAGIVGFNEMYFHAEEIAKAAMESGMHAIITRAIVTPAPGVGERMLEEAKKLYHDYNGKGRLKIYFAPHAQYTVNNEMLATIGKTAKELGAGIHMHISETQGEHESCLAEQGKTPIGLANDLGLLDVPFLAAHCVHVSEEDMEIMASKGATVLSCPKSNLKLGSGVAPLEKMIEKGVHVSIGTDGAASNNKLSVMEEMTYASFLQKGTTNNAKAIPAHLALKLATKNGAEAMGINSGVVEAGKNADLIMIRSDGMRYLPSYDVVSNIVYAASDTDVCMTMVGGDIIYKDGEYSFADALEVKEKMNEYAKLYQKEF